MFIKTGDKVQIITGKDKGKVGTVLKTLPNKDRVIVEGLNLVKKHTRPSGMDAQGGIVETEAAIHVSNVSLVDPSNGKPTKVGIRIEDGKKVRFSKKTGEAL